MRTRKLPEKGAYFKIIMLSLVYKSYNYYPSYVECGLELLLGFLFFSTSFVAHHYWIRKLNFKWYGGKLLRSQMLEIAVLLVSTTFALLACLVAVTVISEHRKSVMYDQHPIIRHFMSFGAPYFIYDILAMFTAYQQKYSENNINTHDKQVPNIHDLKIVNSQRNETIEVWQQFVRYKKLILIHHLLIPLLGIPVSYGERYKIGHFLFAVGFLMEASTPFVSFRRILEILGKKGSLMYGFNGCVMALTFFWCRVYNTLYIYQLFAQEKGQTIRETVIKSVPWVCSCCMIGILVPQLYWWYLMLKGCLKFVQRWLSTFKKNR